MLRSENNYEKSGWLASGGMQAITDISRTSSGAGAGAGACYWVFNISNSVSIVDVKMK